MATVKTTYLGDLRTENIHLQSGCKIITDAPTDNRGKGEAFSPTDLLATALGNCIMTIMGIKAMYNGIDLEGTEIEITKIMANDPRRVAEVIMEFNFPPEGLLSRRKATYRKCGRYQPCSVERTSGFETDDCV